jgi:hypothetical protein
MVHLKVRLDSDHVTAYLQGAPQRNAEVRRLWKEQGAEETVNFLKGAVPIKTGFLRDSVASEFTENGFRVYPTAPYSRFVDQSTKPHRIFPNKANVLRWYSSSGSPIFAAYANHPGSKGVFFMRKTKDAMHTVLRQLYAMIWREQN